MDSTVTQAMTQLEELRKKIGELMSGNAPIEEDADITLLINEYETLQAETDKICRDNLGLSMEPGFQRWAKA